MQLRTILSIVSFLALAASGTSAGAVYARHRDATPAKQQQHSQPSSGSTPWYGCPDKSSGGHSKVVELCDSPPHKGKSFGCTYHTGKGTGTHWCTYDARTGECNGGDRSK
ncbi:hypothetical protein MKEN_01475800 [Mycena kentingensis (nom. inval.)]|nr:hypothetical protein MKEN_01475800 [Mycena kentingensis (nom. inval.)]